MDAAEHKAKEDSLRAMAESVAQDSEASAAFFASWLVFYIDQLRATRAAWEASIERLMPK
jgi:hypothetical protein